MSPAKEISSHVQSQIRGKGGLDARKRPAQTANDSFGHHGSSVWDTARIR